MQFVPNFDDVRLYEECFERDLLQREQTSRSLSEVMERFDDPLVVALDGRWGTGKSFFLKRWVGAHTLQNGGKGITLYFDAFENDYLTDPLVALVAAISARLPAKEKPKIDRVKQAAMKMLKPATKIGLALMTAGASSVLEEVGDAAVAAVGAEADAALANFWQKEEGRAAAMREFRQAMSELMTVTDGEGNTEVNRLIIVIDELDRCRPDFALELLEVIKHFFSVPKVHFILGVNLSALENSVRVRYGSNIDASAYLQKFISFRVSLPSIIMQGDGVSTAVFYANSIAGKMGFNDAFKGELRHNLITAGRGNNISIRDVNKILTSFALTSEEFLFGNIFRGWKVAAFTLVISRVVNYEMFKKFISSTATYEDVLAYYGATPEMLLPKIDGKHNPKQDRPTQIFVYCWCYMLGMLDKIPEEDRGPIIGWFSHFSGVDLGQNIPRRAYDSWLNLFQAD